MRLYCFGLVIAFGLFTNCDCRGPVSQKQGDTNSVEAGASKSFEQTASIREQSGSETPKGLEPNRDAPPVEPPIQRDGGPRVDSNPEQNPGETTQPKPATLPWFFTAGSSKNDIGYALAPGLDRSVILGGSFSSGASIGKTTLTYKSATIAWVSNQGKLQRTWSMEGTEPSTDIFLRSLQSTSSGDVYGLAQFSGPIQVGRNVLQPKGKTHLIIFRIKPNGSLGWYRQCWSENGWINASTLQIDRNNNAYIAGTSSGSFACGKKSHSTKSSVMFVASFAEPDGATQWLRVSSQGGFQERATPLPLLRLASNSMFLFFHTQETNTAKLPNWGGNSIQPGIHMATLSTAGKDLDLQSLGLSKRSSVVDALLDQSTQSLYLSIDYHSELQLNKQKLQPKQGAHSTLITKWKYGNKPPAFVWQAKVEGLTQSIYESRSVRMLLRQGGGLYALINFNRGSVQLGTSLSLKTDREQATAITVMNENGSWLKALSLEGSNTVEACDALSIDNFLYVTGRFTRKLSWQNKEYLSLGDHDFWAMSLNY